MQRNMKKRVRKQSKNVHAGQPDEWTYLILGYMIPKGGSMSSMSICLPIHMSMWKLTRKELPVMLSSLFDGATNIKTIKLSEG